MMPDGRAHTKVNLAMTPIASALFWALTSEYMALAFLCGMILGDLMLSPDLDHRVGAQSYKMWGILRWIWLPYQYMVRHRSPLSHWPILGTTARIVYLLAIPCGYLAYIGFEPTHAQIAIAVSTLAGIELSAWIHYALDWTF